MLHLSKVEKGDINMPAVGFNSQNLADISQSFIDSGTKVHSIGDEISGNLAIIRANWTGDEANLAGREKDFKEIMDNVAVIENNINTIASFLNEKNTDFSQISYKG